MKKYAILLLLLPQVLLAQHNTGKISFYIGGGYMSDAYLQKQVFHSINTVTGSGKHNCIILSAGFGAQLHHNWLAGIQVTYDHFGVEDRSVEYCMTSYMGLIKKAWFSTRSVELSTTLAAGIKTWHMEENGFEKRRNIQGTFQFCPAGVGLKADRFLFELKPGFGASGLFQIGAWYRF